MQVDYEVLEDPARQSAPVQEEPFDTSAFLDAEEAAEIQSACGALDAASVSDCASSQLTEPAALSEVPEVEDTGGVPIETVLLRLNTTVRAAVLRSGTRGGPAPAEDLGARTCGHLSRPYRGALM